MEEGVCLEVWTSSTYNLCKWLVDIDGVLLIAFCVDISDWFA